MSACLLGVECRYDGSARPHEGVRRLGRARWVVPVCPEQLGGLPTPRPRMELHGGDGEALLEGQAWAVDEEGRDRSDALRRGAEQVLRLARLLGAREAVLKERSPSCGVRRVHREGRLVEGCGVTSALLRRAGLRVWSEEELGLTPEAGNDAVGPAPPARP